MKKLLLSLLAFVSVVAVQAQPKFGVKAGVDLSTFKIGAKGLSAKINPGVKPGFYVGGTVNFDLNELFGLQTELLYSYGGLRASVSKDLLSMVFMLMGVEDMQAVDMAGSINTHTLRIPVLVKFQPTDGLSILAGPYISYRVGLGVRYNSDMKSFLNSVLGGKGGNIDADATRTLVKDLAKDNLRKFDVGATLGVEYAFSWGLFIEARYNFSFLNSLKKDSDPAGINKFFALQGMPEDEYYPTINLKDRFGFQPFMRYSALQIGVGYRF